MANDKNSVGGVLIVMNGKTFDARNISKIDIYQLETFQDRISGCLGIIRPGHK